MNIDAIRQWDRDHPKYGSGPMWCILGNQPSKSTYAPRPDGRDPVLVSNLGTVEVLFRNRVQLVVTSDGLFHAHGTGENWDPTPIASCHFGDNPDKDKVIKWAQAVSRLHT